MSKPTIIFVPGLWEGPAAFSTVMQMLQSEGFEAVCCSLLSTGTASPGNPSMEDDIAGIREFIEPHIEARKDVILVLHSAAGFLGSNAIEGFSRKTRREKGFNGGITHIVFITAGVFPEGMEHKPPPFFKFEEGGVVSCVDPRNSLFNDLDDESAKNWIKSLQSHPANGWGGTITYCGWREVDSTYLVCEKDQILPESLQLQCASLAGSNIERCASGHMVIITMPEKVVEVVKDAAIK